MLVTISNPDNPLAKIICWDDTPHVLGERLRGVLLAAEENNGKLVIEVDAS